MTQYGQDASHYDDPITQAAGLAAYTHKLTDGNHYYEDSEYAAALNNAKALGIPILGTYHVLWPGDQASINAQIDWWVARADALTPWWRTFDGPDRCFIWQLDCEPFDYLPRAPNKTEIEQAVTRLLSHGIRLQSIGGYCPEWVYHDTLGGLRVWLWASNYGSNPVGDYRAIYPGDGSSRWHVYSGQTPLALQYGSNATIGNQTTCDANGFRFATVGELVAVLTGNPPPPPNGGTVARTLSDEDIAAIWEFDVDRSAEGLLPAREGLRLMFGYTKALNQTQVPAVAADVRTILAAVQAGVPVTLTDATIAKIAEAIAADPAFAQGIQDATAGMAGTWAINPPA